MTRFRGCAVERGEVSLPVRTCFSTRSSSILCGWAGWDPESDRDAWRQAGGGLSHRTWVGTRVKNAVRCVKELDIEVLDVVFGPLRRPGGA
jgi:hypothetical protein